MENLNKARKIASELKREVKKLRGGNGLMAYETKKIETIETVQVLIYPSKDSGWSSISLFELRKLDAIICGLARKFPNSLSTVVEPCELFISQYRTEFGIRLRVHIYNKNN